MSSVWTRIEELRVELKTIHDEVRQMIWERDDILQPLNTSAMIRLEKLEELHKEIQLEIKGLTKAIDKEKREKELRARFADKTKLTDQEYIFLKTIKEKGPLGIKNKDLCSLLEIKKGTVYSHARTFLVAKFIANMVINGASKYIITPRGHDFITVYSKID